MPSPSADAAPTPHPDGSSRSVSGVDYRLRVLRTIPELASIREAWLRLQPDQITADPDFFEASQRGDPQIVRPHVVVLERDGEPDAMFVARIELLRLASRLGYRAIYAPQVRSITIVYGVILGDVDDDAFRKLLASVRASLANGEADVAIFRYLPIDGPFHRIASTDPPLLSRQHVRNSEVHWELELPGSVDDILRLTSSKTRQKLKHYARKLERTYEGRLAIRRYTEPDEIDEFFHNVEAIAPKTYQHALGVAFGDTAAHRERTSCCLERGWFRGYVLSIDGRPCAFEHGELYRGRFRAGRPGYDPAFSHLRIGTYLLLHILDDLCRDKEAALADYGIGDAEFKRRFGSRSWLEGNVVIYAPTFRGARINLARTALQTGVGALERIIGHGEFARSIKRRLRDRGRPPSTPTA
jgi:CelD/BcsL family acetyltransferase involved in cellulose biosynthesis